MATPDTGSDKPTIASIRVGSKLIREWDAALLEVKAIEGDLIIMREVKTGNEVHGRMGSFFGYDFAVEES